MTIQIGLPDVKFKKLDLSLSLAGHLNEKVKHSKIHGHISYF